MDEDEPPVAEQLADDTREGVRPFAGVAPLEPGETTAFAVDMEPEARYMLADFSESPDGDSYADQGWHGEFRTTSGRPPGRAPTRSGGEP